jgi:tRNA (guanine-N7-)-methyltransferase
LPAPLDFERIFAKPEQPLLIDVGCALGLFAAQMARRFPSQNFLGLEIRETMIKRARRLVATENLTNLHFEFCNATVAFERLLEQAPRAVLQNVTIQFPDPWIKKRHFKRRTIQPPLIEALARRVISGGIVFIQTDVESLAEEICSFFAANPNFRRAHSEKWLCKNPFPVKTERETVVESQKLPIYRIIFERTRPSTTVSNSE